MRKKNFVMDFSKIKIKDFARHAFGNNPIIFFEYEGRRYDCMRQGGLNFWAWKHRPDLKTEENIAFDKLMNEKWEQENGRAG